MSDIEFIFKTSMLKVLKYLFENSDKYLSKYMISKNSGVSRPEYVLEELKRAGWVKVLEINGFKRYRINLENEAVRIFKEFLEKIGYLECKN